MQFPGGQCERFGCRAVAGVRERVGGGGAAVEGDVALGFGEELVDMAVEAGHRREAAQIAQRLGGVVGAPAPVRIHREQRNVAEHDDGRVAGQRRDVLLDEVELVGAQMAELRHVQGVDQPDDVHACGVEAVPAVAARAGTERLSVFLSPSSIESCSPGTVKMCGVFSPVIICLTWSNWSGVARWVKSPVWMTKSGWETSPFTLLMASVKVSLTFALAVLVTPMWLSLIWANRSAGRAAGAASPAVPANPATWESTSPPATVNTTAAPNHAEWRINCRRVIVCGSRSSVIWSPPRCRA